MKKRWYVLYVAGLMPEEMALLVRTANEDLS